MRQNEDSFESVDDGTPIYYMPKVFFLYIFHMGITYVLLATTTIYQAPFRP